MTKRAATLLIVLALSSAVALAQDAQIVTVVVLDVSGSMGGDRLNVAKSEILARAKLLVPSPSAPYIVIPFDSTVRDVKELRNGLAELETYLAGLAAGGSTHIAAGLKEAVARANVYRKAPFLAVTLYTDGQDPDGAALLAQEQQLDRLFHDRSEKGLGQMVILRRWGADSQRLFGEIRKDPHTKLVIADEARLVAVSLTPGLTVRSSRWIDANTLEVELQGHCPAPTGETAQTWSPVRLVCAHPGVTSGEIVQIRPGAPPATFFVRVRGIPPADPKVKLDFDIKNLDPIVSVTSVIIPLFTAARLSVVVTPPQRVRRFTLSPSLQMREPAAWGDLSLWQGSAPIDLMIDARSDMPLVPGGDNEAVVSIDPGAGAQITSGERQWTINTNGTHRVPVTLSFDARRREPLSVRVSLVKATNGLKVAIAPAEPRIAVPSLPPPPVTAISITSITSGPAEWTRLAECVARFEARLGLRVDGPMAPSTILGITAPATVRRLRFEPNVIRRGDQSIRIWLEAEVAPAPAQTNISFALSEIRGKGAIRLQMPRDFKLRVAGPASVPMALYCNGHTRSPVIVSVVDDAQPIVLDYLPVVLGIRSQRAAEGLTGRIASSEKLQLSGLDHPALFHPGRLLLSPSDSAFYRSFFYDSEVRSTITLASAPCVKSVKPAVQPLVLERQAPFKRWLFRAMIGLFIVTLVGLPAWVLYKGSRRSVRPSA
jgi:hypothetical protein